MLTSEKIAELANRNGVRRIAVENFLGTVGSNPNAYAATQNLYQDARDYKWNAATQTAIRRGIELHFKR